MEQWLITSAEKLAQLLKRARRSTAAAAAMDDLETQAWDMGDEAALDPAEDWNL